MKEQEKILKAFANCRRLAIISFLKKEGEARVAKIAEEIKLSFKATSKHLGILAAADILEKDQRSLQVFYRLSDNQKLLIKRVLLSL